MLSHGWTWLGVVWTHLTTPRHVLPVRVLHVYCESHHAWDRWGSCPLVLHLLSLVQFATTANFFFGRGFNLEIFLNLQGSEFIQTLLLIYNHLAKFVVYKSWTRSALLKGTSKCFLVSSITCRNEEAIEWVWFEYKLSFVVKLSTKPHPQTGSLH